VYRHLQQVLRHEEVRVVYRAMIAGAIGEAAGRIRFQQARDVLLEVLHNGASGLQMRRRAGDLMHAQEGLAGDGADGAHRRIRGGVQPLPGNGERVAPGEAVRAMRRVLPEPAQVAFRRVQVGRIVR